MNSKNLKSLPDTEVDERKAKPIYDLDVAIDTYIKILIVGTTQDVEACLLKNGFAGANIYRVGRLNGDPLEVMSRLVETQIDFVIADFYWREMQGEELLKMIRIHYSMPVLMVVRKTDGTDIILTRACSGIEDYIRESFNAEELKIKISTMLVLDR